MTPEEHREIVEKERQGIVRIGVDRAVARKFFTDTDAKVVQAEIGEALLIDRLVVKTSFILGYLLLVLALGASVWAFQWWAFAAVPLIIVLWGGYLAGSSRASSGIASAIVLLAAAVAISLFTSLTVPIRTCVLLTTGAMLFARFTYISSTFFLRALAIRNLKAFQYLESRALVVRDVA